MVSVVLAVFLKALGMSEVQVGAIVTATLLGSAITTLVVGLEGAPDPRRTLLMAATMLMAATGIGFAVVTTFWGLLIVGFVGTLNPSGGDVSLFLPTEQALLPGTMPDEHRTALFARYALVGSLIAAVGSLCAGLPEWLACRFDIDHTNALRVPFVIYAVLAGVIALRYRQLSPSIEPATKERVRAPRLTMDRVPARSAFQRRLLRRWVRDHCAAGGVAAKPLRTVAGGERRDLLLGRAAVRFLALVAARHRGPASVWCGRWCSPTSRRTVC